MPRVHVKPELIRWARERAGRGVEDYAARFRNLADWESGASQPTMKQLEEFAKATHVPFGYFFLPEPPVERLPIPDLRTLPNKEVRQPSPDLLDTIHAMQRRQAWLREDRIECESEPMEFVGSARLTDDADAIGREMRRVLGLGDGWAREIRTWQEAVGVLRRAIEQLGVMAVINGVVGNNTHRKLDVEEFRGFALSDAYAPLIFVNGADAKSAQMFTLAHELAHIWLGESALTDSGLMSEPSREMESWCDRVAAEFLLPARERTQSPAGTGGDFYNNQNTRVGEMFATQVIRAAKGGRLSFREAYDLTGLRGGAFQEYAQRLGMDQSLERIVQEGS